MSEINNTNNSNLNNSNLNNSNLNNTNLNNIKKENVKLKNTKKLIENTKKYVVYNDVDWSKLKFFYQNL